ncbi:MAG: hypothetical protein CVU39_00175 [Chloroflexi bacterium HGW-Chloroflexi-10]|nr:MAG: hypothetical protein CVU39_00175 [Chloroflexi bacterium HGW-Chloroflexi-10]
MKRILPLLLFAGLMAACSLPLINPVSSTTPTQPAMPPTLPVVTLEPLPTETLIQEPTPQITVFPEPTTTPTSFVAYTVTTSVNNLNLRTNPGYLFPISRSLKEGTELTILGIAPGYEWYYVRTQDAVSGWVYTQLIQNPVPVIQLPVVEPSDVEIVTGTLTDEQGSPISGIQFAIWQGQGVNPPRNDANTDINGKFIAFMPQDISGEWNIEFVAISCTSNTMDANCNCLGNICKDVEPKSITVPLPSSEIFKFTWK